MKAEQVDIALAQKFIAANQRLVFWHDSAGEFADYISSGLSGDLAEVQVIDLSLMGGLAAKLRLERDDRSSKFLIYSKGEAPSADQDFLLDIRLYSAQFHADVASIWREELGLSDLYLRDHLKARAMFFNSQERRKKLKHLVNSDDDEALIDLKMLAVLVGSQAASPFAVLQALCHGHMKEGRIDLSEAPQVMAIFKKMDLYDRFWELMRREFSYQADSPSVAGLLRRVFISELFYQTGNAKMPTLAQHLLPTAGQRNAAVFLTQWRDSTAKASSYDATAKAIAEEQKVDETLAELKLDLSALKEVFTFWEAEKRVVSGLKTQVLDTAHALNLEAVASLATERKAGHWLMGPGHERPERRAIADAYDAIVAAAELFKLRAQYSHGFSCADAGALLSAYQKELYRFDRLYRLFCTKAKPAQGRGWDLLKTLADEVERVYDQAFLQPFGREWSRLLDAGFLSAWSSKGLSAQQDFYANNIQRHLDGSERKRAFVIISDAFRYEAATELTEALNGRYRMDATLDAMLGVLPSYTALGMASLLPHQTLSYTDKGDVLIDGQAVAGTEARSKHLASVNGVNGLACQAKDLRVMKQDDARAFVEDKRVVYIYHNVIDARGDSAATEGETFEAVADCIGELVELVQFCVNKFNASKIWLTADHGFLFQQQAPDLTDKSELIHKPEHAVKNKKRYVIGRDLGPTPEAHHGSTAVTASTDDGMEFWIPRGSNRFHFTGGARFVHGGAMPQEVLVPLLTVTQLRGDQAKKSKIEKVSVQVMGSKHNITAPKYRFEFIQTQAVSARRKPITLRAAVYEGTQQVSSVETVTFDSASDSTEERKKSIRLELRTGTFDKTTPYRLVLRDVETDAEVQSVPVVIDRSFDDDF